jgi:RNA polymerase sigma factor (sigma-70 family)
VSRRVGAWLQAERAKMLGHLLAKGLSMEDAEDIAGRSVQEFMQQSAGERPIRHPSGLLWRIFRCNLNDLFRRRARRPQHTSLDEALTVPIAAAAADPSLRAIVDDLLQQVCACLTEEERVAFLHFHLYHFSDREIAAIIGIKEGNVRVKRHRATLKIQRLLREQPSRSTPGAAHDLR